MITEKDNAQNNRIISSFLLGISTSVFAAVAYFFGRQYIENYYQGFGIPKNMLHFDTIEYIYSSVTSFSIFLALMVALLVYGIIKLFFVASSGRDWSIFNGSLKDPEHGIIPFDQNKAFNLYSKFNFWYLSIIYFIFFVMVLVIDLSVKAVELRNMIQFLYVYPCLLFGFYLTQDSNVITIFSRVFSLWKPNSRYKTQTKITWRQIFSIILFASLFYLLYTSFRLPSTWGFAKGISDWTNTSNYVSDNISPPLPIIQLTINKQENYPVINWATSNNLTKNETPLVLLLSTDTELFVRSKERDRISELTIIKKQDIVAIKNLYPR